MRWPGKLGRVMDAVQALRDDRDRLAAELERERTQHLDDVLLLIQGAALQAITFGNCAERVWPEQLDAFLSMARERGAQVIVVSGSGRVHGVHWVHV